jgi:serum/glucocorticoid-regulated kinase 2
LLANRSDVSHETQVVVSLYMHTTPAALANAAPDVFLGVIKVLPRFVEQVQDEWYSLAGGAGHVRLQMCFRPPTDSGPPGIETFDLLKVIGKGSFGKVTL